MRDIDVASRFDEIYDSTKGTVLAYITAKCGRTADIADIVQETYMELFSVLRKRGADYVKNHKAFVLKLAKQKIGKHYTLRDRLRIFVPMTVANEAEEDIALSDFSVDGFMTEDFAVNNILLETARRLITQKPEDVKKAFYLFYDVGLSIPEIAAMLAISESGVKNKLYRTIKELRDLLL